MSIDPHRLEMARRRIAADVLELRAVKLRFKSLIASLELGFAELSEAIGFTIASVDNLEPEVA